MVSKKYYQLLIISLTLNICMQGCYQWEKASRDAAKDLIFVGEFTQGLEGPAVNSAGELFFVNPQRNGTIGRIKTNKNKLDLFIPELPNGSVANGIRFNRNGDMFMADYVNHNILKVAKSSQEVIVFATDSTMNQPNDIAIHSNGTLFASDPNWSDSTGNIWRIDTTGNVVLLEQGMGTTNGIEVAPGDSLLYVGESVQRKVWVYRLSSDGQISNKKLLIEFENFGMDGMRTDVKGNLYITRYGKGTVAIVSPKGSLIGEIQLKGQKPSNIAFGGEDGRACYITCQDRGYIETFRSEFPGRSWQMLQ